MKEDGGGTKVQVLLDKRALYLVSIASRHGWCLNASLKVWGSVGWTWDRKEYGCFGLDIPALLLVIIGWALEDMGGNKLGDKERELVGKDFEYVEEDEGDEGAVGCWAWSVEKVGWRDVGVSEEG